MLAAGDDFTQANQDIIKVLHCLCAWTFSSTSICFSVFISRFYSAMPPRNFSWFVEDRLAALGFPSTRADIEFLCSRGVKRLISLTESRPSLHGFPLTHVHIPIVDFTPPSIEQVNEFLSAVEKSNSQEEVSVWLFNSS